MKKLLPIIALTLLASAVYSQESPKQLTIDYLLSIKRIGDPQLSPDEKWIAYTVSAIDTAKDKSFTRIWMVSTDGGKPIPMTAKGKSSSRPRWTADGKYLTFLSTRGENAKSQVWKLNRLGGEAQQVSKVKQGVSGYEWSPDSKRLLLVLKDPKPAELTKDTKDDKKPLPHVIDRIHFKNDYTGYLDNRRNHLYIYTPGDSTAVQITSGDYDDSDPRWSPDGLSIAFVSNRSANPDLSYDSNIWVVSADNMDKGQNLIQVTKSPVSDASPRWSPDGLSIVYVSSRDEKSMPFSMNYLALASADGTSEKLLLPKLDRRISTPRFSPDGKLIYFRMEDGGERQLATVTANGKNLSRIVKDRVSVSGFQIGENSLYTLQGTSDKPSGLFRWKEGSRYRLSQKNDSILIGLKLNSYETVQFKSKDGTPVEGFVLKPVDFDPSKKYPLILWIHGGPIGQFTHSFNSSAQLFAANGYVVLMVNPRGSTGQGEVFTKAIFADWGNKDYEDVMAGVDHLIDLGYVDSERLGVGGWSYGGILTNFVITKTDRFKAAISGASLGITMGNFGHDMYIKWYNAEFGMPWENRELWEKMSPFNQIENITTPTLWIGGGSDWNVPIINSEQMYLGMKALGRKTQLVVYPGEHHGIRRPSFQKDRFERFVSWYDKYLK